MKDQAGEYLAGQRQSCPQKSPELQKAREESSAETHQKVLDNSQDRLGDMAQSVEEEEGERTKQELVDMSDDVP